MDFRDIPAEYLTDAREAQEIVAPLESAGMECSMHLRPDGAIEANARRPGEAFRLGIAALPRVGVLVALARSLVDGARFQGWVDLGPFRVATLPDGGKILFDDGPIEQFDWRRVDPDGPVYGVIDANTGESLDDQFIWRADAREGWYDRYPPGPDGQPQIDPADDSRILSERIHRDIKIIPRDERES